MDGAKSLGNTLRLGAAAAASAFAMSCGSGDGPPSMGGGMPPVLEATFDSIQTNVFDARCIACHIGAGAPAGLRLDDANSYALLVGIASEQEPSLLRVEPGDPDNSYLIRKLEGTAGSGEQMPLDGAPLSQSEIAVIRQWISDGALREPGGMPPTEPIRVSSLSPLPDSVELRLPLTIMAIFDRELDASTVNATTFLVERSGGDGAFDDGNEVEIVPVSVTVPAMNPRTAIFDLTTTASVEDSYRVTLVGDGPAVIADLDANALDGEYTGSLPSGDGTAGGDFVALFEVVGVQPTLESIQDNVFTTTCAGCHTGPMSNDVNDLPGGMDLTSADASFANLVGVASLEETMLNRVEPGDADASYVVQKIEGTAATGFQMPPLGMPLDEDTIGAIREWIDNGANR
jgi:hypothetical protein